MANQEKIITSEHMLDTDGKNLAVISIYKTNEHMRTPMAVKIIGENGTEWDELKRAVVNPECGTGIWRPE